MGRRNALAALQHLQGPKVQFLNILNVFDLLVLVVAFFVVVSGKVDKKSSKLLLIVVVFDPGWVNFFVEDSVVLTNGFRGLK